MTNKRRSFKDAATEIDTGLNGLLGALGEAIDEMVNRLDDGRAGAVSRNLTFDTEKGPVRAQAGVRVRMGGLDTGSTTPAAKPVNPERPKPTAAADVRDLAYDIIEDDNAWILTADIPGVDEADLDIRKDGDRLRIATTGARKYLGNVTLEGEFDPDAIATTLRNGILTLEIPKGDET